MRPDALPYQRIVSDTSTETERVQALSALADSSRAADVPLVIVSAPALMHKTTTFIDFMSAIHSVELGTNIDPYQLLGQWESMGYRRENIVEVPGTMSHRGGIIDIYPPTSDRAAPKSPESRMC